MADVQVGGMFAGYRIERALGRGGMGTVYLAQHPRLPRLTALKLLDTELLAATELRTRFEREADVVARLDHPNIVAVHDRGIEGRFLWIAMQYVAGTDAASVGIVDPARAMRIVGATAAALDYAHRRGVLHRDVKPANILLAEPEYGEPERILLADFGIARLRDETNGLTRTGTFTATLAFAAPEQMSGAPVDHRCDQYALACTLYALLTGAPPFGTTNPAAVIQGQMRQPPPRLTGRRPDLPPALDAVLTRALAKRPEDRYGGCGEFAAAAADALRTERPSPPSPVPVARQWVPQPPGPQSPATPVLPVRIPVPPRPADRRARAGIVAALAVLLIVAAGAVSWAVWRHTATSAHPAATRSPTDAWHPDEQRIADVFPGLVSRDQLSSKGSWKGAWCSGIDADAASDEAAIWCSGEVDFYVYDYRSADNVANRLVDRAVSTSHRPHARCHSDPLLVVPARGSAEAASGVVWTTFPDDPARSRFAIGVRSAGRTVDDLLRQWWTTAPICG